MNNQKQTGNAKLSLVATWWFYIALVLASLCYLLVLGVSGYRLKFVEIEGRFFTSLMIFIGSLNGLAAIGMALRRKPLGAIWSLVFVVFVSLDSLGSGFTSRDLAPMIILVGLPTLMLLSQLPTLKKVAGQGPGWGLGKMATPGSAIWLFRIACGFSFIFYLGVLALSYAFLLTGSPRTLYSVYMLIIAGACGLYAALLVSKKERSGLFLSIAPCVFFALSAINIGWGWPFSSFRDFSDLTFTMLALSILMAVMLFRQKPYLEKFNENLRSVFQKVPFTNSASFSDDDLAALYRSWSAYDRALTIFYVPGMAFAFLAGPILSKGVGGAIGNFSAVALLFGAICFALIMGTKRKKRYLACLAKLGLTEDDVKQTLQDKKQVQTASG